MGDNWEVGLSSISLPDTQLNVSVLANPEEEIFGETCYIMLGSQRIQKTFNMMLKTAQDSQLIQDGHKSMVFTVGQF